MKYICVFALIMRSNFNHINAEQYTHVSLFIFYLWVFLYEFRVLKLFLV